jgi:hypothetical protein
MPHTPIILETTIPENIIKIYIEKKFRKPNVYIKEITKRNDKLNYANYLTKQRNILTNDNYNYKIKIE